MNSNEEVKPIQTSGTATMSLLDERTVERIRAKETAQVAAREARRQKKSEAEKLADAMRREELRQIPKASRSAEQQREFARLEARRHRANATKGQALSNVATAEEFWSANRLTADQRKIKAWKEQEERVLDIICWMNTGGLCSPHDPCFVGIDEGLAGIDEHIAKTGLIHDDPISYRHDLLKDFLPPWGVWADRDIHDPIWGTVEGFWKNPGVFQALCSESEATAIYAKYGVRVALSAFAVREFTRRVKEHINGDHKQSVDEKCWLCGLRGLAVNSVGEPQPVVQAL